MIICGVKVSHDGGIAVVDGNRLVFSVEIEKLNNSRRYIGLSDLNLITDILDAENIDAGDIDRFVIDGWFPAPGASSLWVPTSHHGHPLRLPVAPYVSDGARRDPLHRLMFPCVDGGILRGGYASYTHASGHALGAYCSSPFASRGADSLVLAWDGGMLPHLYHVDAERVEIKYLGPLFPLVGNIFGQFCWQLEPFYRDLTSLSEEELERHELEVPGKAMAYAALGHVEPGAFKVFDEILDEFDTVAVEAASSLGQAVVTRRRELFPRMSNADIIATWQAYIGRTLLDGLAQVLRRSFGDHQQNLCLAGGCALNIKWNSMLRDSGMFSEVWVPPFPNDSGAAIGTACCEMVRETKTLKLEWDLFQGPALHNNRHMVDWPARPCDERQLAELLHYEGEPVVVLYGRAELGPRALGNRSILAPATDAGMKDRLNDIKGREDYRPVAPICLESRSSEVFAPGGIDHFMVFEHRMRPGWQERVPAIVHLDGSARLQTINPLTPTTRAGLILSEYERLSGIPVLCNTSANLCGHGFFSDVAAAINWGRTRYVWAEGTLYTNPGSVSL